MKDVKKSDLNLDSMISSLTTRLPTAVAKLVESLWYLWTTLLTLLMYTVASPDPGPDPDPDPDPDPNPRGRGQLPNPKSAILR